MFDMAIVNSWKEYKDDLLTSNSKDKALGLLDFLGEYLYETKKRPLEDDNGAGEENPDEENDYRVKKENCRTNTMPGQEI